MLPASLRDETGNTYADVVAPAAVERGEPWLTLFAPDDVSDLLTRHGYGVVEHVRQRDSVPAAFWERTDSLRPVSLSVLARATLGTGPSLRLESGACLTSNGRGVSECSRSWPRSARTPL